MCGTGVDFLLGSSVAVGFGFMALAVWSAKKFEEKKLKGKIQDEPQQR